MLALFRVERALNVTTVHQISKTVTYFQKRYSCGGVNYNYKMLGGNSNKRSAEGIKQKSMASVWRPVSTQSCSAEGTELDEPNIGPATLSDKAEEKELEGSVSSMSKFSISLQVGTSLFRFIKGKGGSVQEQIEKEMGIRIIFPSSRNEETIVIEGASPDSIARASERIQLIIDEAVKSSALDYSHFISLPLAIHPQLVDKLVDFQNSVLGMNNTTPDEVSQVEVTIKAQENTENVKVDVSKIPLVSYPPKSSGSSSSRPTASTLSELGIEKSIFIKPKTFHLTVLMLKLWNKERVATAVRIFEGIKEEVMDALDGQPVSIKLKGLDCMKGSLAKARVLYAPVEVLGGEERLLHACKVISDAFIKGGLVLEKDAKQMLKLHATVMNARHRKRTKYTKKFDSFDARGVMEKYGSEDWGEYLIPEVHLSQRFLGVIVAIVGLLARNKSAHNWIMRLGVTLLQRVQLQWHYQDDPGHGSPISSERETPVVMKFQCDGLVTTGFSFYQGLERHRVSGIAELGGDLLLANSPTITARVYIELRLSLLAEKVNNPKHPPSVVEPNIRPTTLSHKEDMASKGSTSSMNKHSISLKGGASYFRFIKEKGGSMSEELEKEMGIRMIFPTSRNEDSIIIEGASPDSIARAAKRIQPIIDEAVKSSALDNTHFISLPLAIHPQLVDKLVNFQNSVSKSSTLSDNSMFIKPKTFHLTVLMLRLYNKERVDAAVKILKGIAGELKNALGGQPVSIKLKGLDIMRGSQDKAQVLYAPVEVVGGEDRLLHVCKAITDAFIKGGLVFEKDCQRALKLHATVMNAGHRRTFDARGILEKYGSDKWGEYHIPQVHLSQRFVFDANGYYHCCASIPLP
uniref:Activating signal cointegrator 1 complex subunit 1 n=1 Tax=Tanacetum cinerariifolium TaxID=118510 RepID=A0A6L2K987_TANCI|nr:activating signal cointegrator 1 complex subunit 1 [Tanacetum cinerariifolium]